MEQDLALCRCSINGHSTSLRVFKELGALMVDVNGQHAAQTLRCVPALNCCHRPIAARILRRLLWHASMPFNVSVVPETYSKPGGHGRVSSAAVQEP